MISKDFYKEVYECEKRLSKEAFLKAYSWLVQNKNLWEETPISRNERIWSDLSQKELLLLEEVSSEGLDLEVFEEEEE